MRRFTTKVLTHGLSANFLSLLSGFMDIFPFYGRFSEILWAHSDHMNGLCRLAEVIIEQIQRVFLQFPKSIRSS